MFRIKGSAVHSHCTCVDRPSRSAGEQFHNNAPHRKCLREKRLPASACLFSLESGEALSRTVVRTALIQPSEKPTTHDTNTRVELTIVTILSISERLAIANVSLLIDYYANFGTVVTSNTLNCLHRKDKHIGVIAWLSTSASERAMNSWHRKRTLDVDMI